MSSPSVLLENFYALLRSQTILELRQTLAHGPQERDLKVLGWTEHVWEEAVIQILQEKLEAIPFDMRKSKGPREAPESLLTGVRARVAATLSAYENLNARALDVTKALDALGLSMARLRDDIIAHNQRVMDSLKEI